MAVNPSPFGPKPQIVLSDGTPAVGGKLFFYVAGSSTKQNTYTSSTGLSANTNPVLLNALGQPTTEIWFTAGLTYKVVYAPSTDTDPPTSPVWTIDNLLGINDVTVSQDQWVAFGGTPTFVNATSFTLVGDQTSTFHLGRRLKTTNSGGTVYSTISVSAFAALTTVTVVNDTGTIDSGLSAVSYGILSATNPSTPLLADTFPVASGSADKTKKLRLELDGLTTGTTRVWTAADLDIALGKQPTTQVFTSGSGTYTTPAGATRIKVRLVGGGGGGSGNAAAAATAGGNTTFSTLTGSGGAAGSASAGGAGGATANGDFGFPGGTGGGGALTLAANTFLQGGQGGISTFGGGGAQGVGNANGGNGATNTGSGGGGGGGASGGNSGGGGGAGGYVEKIITAPAATYSYGVGAGGGGSVGGASTGGTGAAGIVIVEEFYN